MIRYLLIDWDNTIWDFSANSALSLDECYSGFSLAAIFPHGANEFKACYYQANDELWSQYRQGRIDRKFLVANRFYNTLRLAGVDDYGLAQRINDAYILHVEDKSELLPGAKSTLEYLRRRGYVLIVVTNGFSEVQQRKLRNSGVAHLFDYKVLSDDAGALKPSREFFDYTFRTTGAIPGESIVIGDDAEADIAGAVRYGLRSIYLNRFGKPCPYPVDYEIQRLPQLMDIL